MNQLIYPVYFFSVFLLLGELTGKHFDRKGRLIFSIATLIIISTIALKLISISRFDAYSSRKKK
jgi:hypothetical protein